MRFVTKSAKLSFSKDFKPKSLDKFISSFRSGGTDEELTKIFDKLNGNDRTANKKVRKAKSKGSPKSSI